MAKAIPEGLHTVTPALTIEGASEAIAFYKAAFGAVEEMRAPDPSGQKIWHAVIRIGDSSIFINDTFPEMGAAPNRSKLWIYTTDVDALFNRAVGAGATIKMPPGDMFWGDRIAMVGDRFGQEWALAQHTQDLSPEELQRAQEAEVAKYAAAPDKK
jgi:PhnB protein